MKKKSKFVPNKGFEKVEFETFCKISSYELRNLQFDEPSSFNGFVSVRKYKITIEEIAEPPEVIGERIQELWSQCDNHHQWDPLRVAAMKVGWELVGDPGSKREKK